MKGVMNSSFSFRSAAYSWLLLEKRQQFFFEWSVRGTAYC